MKIVEEATSRELFVVGDTVKLVDSPLDRIRKGAKGKVMAIHGDLVNDPSTLISVEFRVAGSPFTLCSSAARFNLSKHTDILPDAEGSLSDSEGEE